jgi:hypothetical protein
VKGCGFPNSWKIFFQCVEKADWVFRRLENRLPFSALRVDEVREGISDQGTGQVP